MSMCHGCDVEQRKSIWCVTNTESGVFNYYCKECKDAEMARNKVLECNEETLEGFVTEEEEDENTLPHVTCRACMMKVYRDEGMYDVKYKDGSEALRCKICRESDSDLGLVKSYEICGEYLWDPSGDDEEEDSDSDDDEPTYRKNWTCALCQTTLEKGESGIFYVLYTDNSEAFRCYGCLTMEEIRGEVKHYVECESVWRVDFDPEEDLPDFSSSSEDEAEEEPMIHVTG